MSPYQSLNGVLVYNEPTNNTHPQNQLRISIASIFPYRVRHRSSHHSEDLFNLALSQPIHILRRSPHPARRELVENHGHECPRSLDPGVGGGPLGCHLEQHHGGDGSRQLVPLVCGDGGADDGAERASRARNPAQEGVSVLDGEGVPAVAGVVSRPGDDDIALLAGREVPGEGGEGVGPERRRPAVDAAPLFCCFWLLVFLLFFWGSWLCFCCCL